MGLVKSKALKEYVEKGEQYDKDEGLDKIKWLKEKWNGDLNGEWSPSMLWAHEQTKLEFTKEARDAALEGNPEMAVQLFTELIFNVTMCAPTVSEDVILEFLNEILNEKNLEKTKIAIEKKLNTKDLYAALFKKSIQKGLPNYVMHFFPSRSREFTITEDLYEKPGTLAVLVHFSTMKIKEVPLKLAMQKDPFSLVVFLKEAREDPKVLEEAFMLAEDEKPEGYFKRIWLLCRNCAYDSARLSRMEETRYGPELLVLSLFCVDDFVFENIKIIKKHNAAATGVYMDFTPYRDHIEREPDDPNILAQYGNTVTEEMVSRALEHDEWTIVHTDGQSTDEYHVSADMMVALLLMHLQPTQELLLKALEVRRIESVWYMVHAGLHQGDELNVIELLEKVAENNSQEYSPDAALQQVVMNMALISYVCVHTSFITDEFYEKLLRPAITSGVQDSLHEGLIQRYELKLFSYADGIVWWYLVGKPYLIELMNSFTG